MERALWLMGLTTGAVQRVVGLNMMTLEDEKCSSSADAEVVNRQSCQEAVWMENKEVKRVCMTGVPGKKPSTRDQAIDIQHPATIANV